jgi:hypothetical protein
MMKSTASLTLRSLSGVVILQALLLLPPGWTSAQTFSREIQARFSAAQIISDTDEKPAVSAELALLISDKSQRITSRVVFHEMSLNAAQPTAGWFTIYDARDETIFEGRWMATTFRDGATLISLEGRGQERFTARRIKLKLKATVDEKSVLTGEGTGEIR